MESEQRKNAIRGAYHLTGSNNFYDGMITCSTFSGKAVCRMVWAMNRRECEDYLSKALWLDLPMRYTPYSKKKETLIRFFLK